MIGVVIVGSSAMFWSALALLPTTTPIAPASWAFLVFVLNEQIPRSTSAILPAIAAAFTNGVQPLEVDGSAAPSSASTMSAVFGVTEVTAGPNWATPAGQIRAIDAGELITTIGMGGLCVEQAPSARTGAGESVPALLMRSTTSPQMSEYASFSAPGCHW